MADEDPLFNLDVVRDFIIANGGKVQNHQLVSHFKTFLNDPRRKAANREKFKQYVNTLSSVKLDKSGEKVLVLKKKYRDDADFSTAGASKEPEHKPKLNAPKKKLQDSFQVRSQSPSPPPSEDNNNVPGAGAVAAAADVSELAEEEIVAGAPDSRIAPKEATPPAEPSEEMSLLDEIQKSIAAKSAGVEEVEQVDELENVPEEPEPEPEPEPEQMEEVEEPSPEEPVFASAPEPVEDAPEPAHAPEPAPAPPTAPEPTQSAPAPPAPSAPAPPPAPSAPAPAPLEKIAEGMDTMDTQTPKSEGEKSASVSSGSSREQSVNRDVEQEPLNQSSVSVREFTKQFNKKASQSDLLSTPTSSQKRVSKGHEEEHENITLDATEREWMVTSSGWDYQKIHKLLNKHPRLAVRKDFITGMTALHWAAKHGNVDVVKMLCSYKDVDVNARSNGGYTPLHLAAMQGHEAVIESLVQTYQADLNLRDHSGRKAKQYLKNSASTRTQQLLQSSHLKKIHGNKQGGSSGAPAPFRRQGSYSNKIRSAGHFGIHASVAVRSSWMAPDPSVHRRSSDRSTSPSPAASPSALRRSSAPVDDSVLMPPPQGIPPTSHRARRPRRTSSNKENHSDSETTRSRSQSPRTSAVSASDPNLAATAAAAAAAQMYQSTV